MNGFPGKRMIPSVYKSSAYHQLAFIKNYRLTRRGGSLRLLKYRKQSTVLKPLYTNGALFGGISEFLGYAVLMNFPPRL